MWSRRILGIVTAVIFFVVSGSGVAADLPASFPDDVPVADYMSVVGVTEVGNSMMVNFHAPDKTVKDVAEWFQSGLAAAGWESEGEQVSAKDAILAYRKSGRRCGVTVTNFILNGSMQMDDSIKGVTVQITGAKARNEGAAESAADAVDSVHD